MTYAIAQDFSKPPPLLLKKPQVTFPEEQLEIWGIVDICCLHLRENVSVSHKVNKVALAHFSPGHQAQDNVQIFPDVRKSEVFHFLLPDLGDQFGSLRDWNISSSLVIQLLQQGVLLKVALQKVT